MACLPDEMDKEMSEIRVSLPDGSVKTYPAGVTARQVLASWREDLVPSAVAVRFGGNALDLSRSLHEDGALEVIGIASREGLGILRHSISHVMAQAVQDSFQGVQVSIGPSIEDGFYYDFDYAETFTPEDLAKVEARMTEIVRSDKSFERREISREEAITLFQKKGENYKVELIQDLPPDVKTVSLYSQGDYVDLCRGPHIPSTGMIGPSSC